MNRKKPEGLEYEILIRRAFRLNDRTLKHGADADIMRRLVHAENSDSVLQKQRAEGYFQVVIVNIQNALREFLKFSLTPEEKAQIIELLDITNAARESEDLLDIIRDSLDATRRFIN